LPVKTALNLPTPHISNRGQLRMHLCEQPAFAEINLEQSTVQPLVDAIVAASIRQPDQVPED
jgi:hypothetical protein